VLTIIKRFHLLSTASRIFKYRSSSFFSTYDLYFLSLLFFSVYLIYISFSLSIINFVLHTDIHYSYHTRKNEKKKQITQSKSFTSILFRLLLFFIIMFSHELTFSFFPLFRFLRCELSSFYLFVYSIHLPHCAPDANRLSCPSITHTHTFEHE